MPTLAELIQEHSQLTAPDEEWLRLLVSDWQLISDLSFADLAALVRPNARAPLSARERQALKSEIEALIQSLDELRTQLAG